jgi:hypothetical protein
MLTHFADVRLLARMRSLAHSQILERENAAAFVANKRLLVRVRSFVHNQIT